MRPSLSSLLQTTTFRLGVVQAGAVLAFVVLLLSYVFFATTGQLLAEAEAAAETEFAVLARSYGEGGIRQLTENVRIRAERRDDLVFSLREADGRLVAGEALEVPAPTGPGRQRVEFRFERPNPDGGGPESISARGLQERLLGGPTLVVASDLSFSERISERLTRALALVAGLGMILAVASGLLAARQAARRAETLSQTARDVMKGDLSVRAPVLGAGDEFDQLALDLNAMLSRLERLVIATRSAGDAIAHDLRTPLTRQRQKLEAALSGPPDAQKDRDALQAALEESDRLLKTFAAVLRLARVEASANWKFVDYNISQLASKVYDFYGPAAEDQGLSLETAIAPNIVIAGEPTLVNQALFNLVENAMKYTSVGGKIRITVRRQSAEWVEMNVTDDGPGVPPEDRERVVRRFERLDRSRQSEGLGLGLSLVDAVARLHRGQLILQDGQYGGPDRPGLSVTLVLPLMPQKGAA